MDYVSKLADAALAAVKFSGTYVSKTAKEYDDFLRTAGKYAAGIAAGAVLLGAVDLGEQYTHAAEPKDPQLYNDKQSKKPKTDDKKDDAKLAQPAVAADAKADKTDAKKDDAKPATAVPAQKPKKKIPMVQNNSTQIGKHGVQFYDYDGFGAGAKVEDGKYNAGAWATIPTNKDIVSQLMFGAYANGDISDDGSMSGLSGRFGVDSAFGKAIVNYAKSLTDRKTVTSSDTTNEDVNDTFMSFRYRICPSLNDIFSLQLSHLDSVDSSITDVVDPDVTVNVSEVTRETQARADYNYLVDRKFDIGAFLHYANATAEASVDGANVLDKNWDVWKVGANVYQLSNVDASYFAELYAAMGDGVSYKFGGNAFGLWELSDDVVAGLKIGSNDGRRYAGFILGNMPLPRIAERTKSQFDSRNDITLTDAQKKLAELDIAMRLLRKSKAGEFILNAGYAEQTPDRKGFEISGIASLGNSWGISASVKSGYDIDSYEALFFRQMGDATFGFGGGRSNPSGGEGESFVTLTLGLGF